MSRDALIQYRQVIESGQSYVDRGMYKEGGREELAAREAAEIDVIESFLPAQLSEEETVKAVESAIAQSGAASIKDMGKVMGVLKAKYAGEIDMGKVSALVKEKLG